MLHFLMPLRKLVRLIYAMEKSQAAVSGVQLKFIT